MIFLCFFFDLFPKNSNFAAQSKVVTMSRHLKIMNYKKPLSMSLMVLTLFLLFAVDGNAQVRSVHRTRTREAVSVDCDTALTSDLRIVRRPYKLSDNLFWGVNLTGYRSLISQANNLGLFQMLRPGGEFFFGKYFTPWISASLNLGYNMQNECIPIFDEAVYTFHSAAVTLEAQLCLNRLFSRYRPGEKYLFYAVAGGGAQSAFSFDDLEFMPVSILNRDFHVAPYFRAGAMAEWRASEGTSVTACALWSGTTSAICGLSAGHKHRGVEVSIGLNVRLPNHYASRSFQNCRGNEVYYFNALEQRLLDDHQYQLRQYRKGKYLMPEMKAEEDTILIFPYGYAYLTPRQEAKLDRAAQMLEADSYNRLVIDLYPIVSKDDPKVTPLQTMRRCEVAIMHYFQRNHERVRDNQVQFIHHLDQSSPIEDQSIWVHGAILHYLEYSEKEQAN